MTYKNVGSLHFLEWRMRVFFYRSTSRQQRDWEGTAKYSCLFRLPSFHLFLCAAVNGTEQ